jgi:CheY-like chemotaxis protein
MDVNKESANLEAANFGNLPPSPRLGAILLVDDTRETRLMTKWFLDYVGYVVHAFSSAEDALVHFDPKVHDLVVTDNSMPMMTGAEMAHIIKLRSPSTPVLMFTGAAPKDRSCLDVVIEKPGSLPMLKDAIDLLLAARR